MDTSKDYIRMCETASEIQDTWIPNMADFVEGDFVGYIKDVSAATYAINPLGEDSRSGKYAWYYQGELTWLPRQDQLQDMLLNPKNTGHDCISTMIRLFGVFNAVNSEKYKSMEQLWLSFVMKEKYNKKWNGEEWINQG